MSKMNQDSWSALFLLLFSTLFFNASYDIRDLGFETLGAEVWPRIILVILALLSLILLVRSISQPPKMESRGFSWKQWFATYSNALWCFSLFLLFLVTLPYFGMLLGGVLFVFALLCIVGHRTTRATIQHIFIATGCIGVMWAIFTFGLKVMLPQGQLFSVW